MAVSDVQLCNLALASIGGSAQIGSLEDPTAEARKCKLLFDTTFRKFLRDFEWNEASVIIELAEMAAEPIFGWGHQYLYPSDALKINRITTATDSLTSGGNGVDSGWDYAIGTAAAPGYQKVIWTNAGSPIQLEYTRKITCERLNDQQVDALQYLMAAKLAMSLKNDQKKADSMMAYYAQALAEARGDNETEHGVRVISGAYFDLNRNQGW